MSNEILIEVWGLYDGWACKYNETTGEFKWRDELHQIKNYPTEKRKQVEQNFLKRLNEK